MENDYADLFVDEVVLVELNAAKQYNPTDEPQLQDELKASSIKMDCESTSEKKKLNSNERSIEQKSA